MSSSRGTREPVDPNTRLCLTFYPYTSHTVAEVDLGWRGSGGLNRSRLAYWHIDVRRSEIAGRSTDDVLRLFVNGILRHLDGTNDPADHVAIATGDGPEASAPLEGPQGEAHTQTALPGLDLPV